MKIKFLGAIILAIGILLSGESIAQPPHAKSKGKHYKHSNKYNKAQSYHGYAAHGKYKIPGKARYYYYPNANIYYNPANRKYAYYRSGNWVWVPALPPAIVIANAPRHVVYYEGPQVWVANPVHVRTFRPGVNVNIQF